MENKSWENMAPCEKADELMKMWQEHIKHFNASMINLTGRVMALEATSKLEKDKKPYPLL